MEPKTSAWLNGQLIRSMHFPCGEMQVLMSLAFLEARKRQKASAIIKEKKENSR